MVLLRHALRADLDTIVEIWVDAFANDPYFRWIAASDADYTAFANDWMRFIVELAFERGHTYLDSNATVAAAWIPPDLSLVSADDIARGRSLIARHSGDHVADMAFAAIVAARGHAIEAPHWTLQYIGSAHRGRGLGQAAVGPMLARCDAEQLPCGLVSTNPRNVAFYERHGFRVVAEEFTPDGVTALRPMHRQPRAT